jgi:GTPase SAR1 family protein
MCTLKEKEDDDEEKLIFQHIFFFSFFFSFFVKMCFSLLAGAGESGKSTVMKQLRCIFGEGFDLDELSSYKPIVYYNVLSSARVLLLGAEQFGYEVSGEFEKLSEWLKNDNLRTLGLDGKLAKKLKGLWQEEGIQKAYLRRNELPLPDSTRYCFENVERIASEDYVPTPEDCIHMRSKTTGIVEFYFETGGTSFNVVDVGGQRSERRKWIHCFQNVTAIVFFVALSEFDMTLVEDRNVNRMHESLALFRDIINSKWFTDTALILFLNKKDLFKIKIQEKDLTCCFPDYKGGKNYGVAVKYIEQQFLQTAPDWRTEIYVHRTCATDRGNIEFVFRAVREVLIKRALHSSGL